jgi:hypothetical protein
MEPNTINAKPAGALFGGQVAVLVIGLLNRYTSYNPSVEEATSIVGLCAFAAAWLVPERLWRRANEGDA